FERDGKKHRLQIFKTYPKGKPKGKRYALKDCLIYDEDDKMPDGDNKMAVNDNISGKGKISEKNNDTKIYVVTHKDYEVVRNPLYEPITVGSFQKSDWIWEQDGKNISELNHKINECTAIYWMWKNSKAEIIGLNHYRRYFYNNELRCRENILTEDTIRSVLKDYDMIVYKGRVPEDATIEEEMRWDLKPEVFDFGYDIITRNISKFQPDYLNDFYGVMQEKECLYCNMFVAKKELFREYCQWLFSFLLPAAKEADVSGFDFHDERIIGFFAERMLTVWVRHNHIKIKPLPVFIP
ncbi:MAG: DUF4422 domain-containing protein, partial [Lachnospiraceae bacterium]|nr:DUF4422 domain-containing protein [Lachnospiraceae bacterium]